MRPFKPTVASMAGAVYSRLAARLADFEGPTFPLHIGDTWRRPPEGCALTELELTPDLHRYSGVHGNPALLDVLVDVERARTGLDADRQNLLVTAGATGGLTAAVAAVIEPGDEVLVLAPSWPLLAGAVRVLGGTVVHVPWFGEDLDDAAARETLARHLTERTVAIYWNAPNNPTGALLSDAHLAVLADVARAHDLWLLADEVYEDFVYDGQQSPVRALAPERTAVGYSFSKAYGMAGNRVGYLVGPREWMAQARKVTTHTFYSAPTACQRSALNALGPAGAAWKREAAGLYAEVGREAARRLGSPAPVSGTFLWLDVGEALAGRDQNVLLEACVARGLLVAPGPTFGDYPGHIRVCFTAVEPTRTLQGIDLLTDALSSI